MEAYEDMIRNTATKAAPWYVVPADNKWFTRVVVAAAVIDALAALDLHYPKVDESEIEGAGGGKAGVASREVIARCLISIWRFVLAPRSVSACCWV